MVVATFASACASSTARWLPARSASSFIALSSVILVAAKSARPRWTSPWAVTCAAMSVALAPAN